MVKTLPRGPTGFQVSAVDSEFQSCSQEESSDGASAELLLIWPLKTEEEKDEDRQKVMYFFALTLSLLSKKEKEASVEGKEGKR